MNVQIRPAEGSDILKIVAIARHSPESSQWPAEEYVRSIVLPPDTCSEECIVAVSENLVAAFIVTRTVADEMEILNLAVVPQRRRQGIASALLQYALRDAAKHHARRAYLEVRASNSAAIAFYIRHGFARAGLRRAYYSSPAEDAIVLSMVLD